ncbi:probable leucine-rich repeat-containing protein 7 at N-terminal half [Coccomyxa sp. Obi]|nr:probable leucine-rich repeat-containing protein 7 at N-terminal half [Coccomyxa sp. Obi]
MEGAIEPSDVCGKPVPQDERSEGLKASEVLQLVDNDALVLSGHSLGVIPASVCTLTTLLRLDLSKNKLKILPDAISTLQALTDLNLSSNELVTLPASIGSMRSLIYLNLMSNSLTALPDEIGNLGALYRLGLKGNKLTALPNTIGGLTSLVELFITDNLIHSLPAEIGQCTSLVKMQASFNRLSALPAEVANLQKLELLRVAVNLLSKVPSQMAACSGLAWMSLAGNPACPPPPVRGHIADVTIEHLSLGVPLGEGASGDVFAAHMEGEEVAVKVFKGEVSPDGKAADEIAVTCYVNHPHLTRVLATLQQPHALVLKRVAGRPLAAKPNLQSLLRCRWPPDAAFSSAFVARVALCVASALQYLHAHCICHGDVYAHNILVDNEGHATLLDYGASFFYKPGTLPYEAQEVRAFGLFLSDMLARVEGADKASSVRAGLEDIAAGALHKDPLGRPSFEAIATHCSWLTKGKGVIADSASSLQALHGK